MSYMHNQMQAARDDVREIQEKVSEGRREFFKQVGQGAVATAMATTAMHLGTRDVMKPVVDTAAAAADAHGGWKNLFALKPNYLYMNIGTTGSTPAKILDQYENWFYQNAWECQAYVSTSSYCLEQATGYGANPSELIMSFTTTDGMLKTLAGVKWPYGEGSVQAKVITTNMEHSGGLGPLYSQVNKNNVKSPGYKIMWVDKFTGEVLSEATEETLGAAPNANAVPAVIGGEMIQTPTGIRKNDKVGLPGPNDVIAAGMHPDEVYYQQIIKPELDAALEQVGGKAFMLMFSSPPYLTGIRYPEKQMCKWAEQKGIISSIDAAHLTGMININLHDMGVDLFAGSGHKWQCGPGQTGVAYIRNGKKGQEAWTFSNRTGTAPAYQNERDTPLFWCYNDTFRMSKYTDAAGTNLRAMVNGMRRPTDNVGSLIQSVGNNNIQMNRALYECMDLWQTIGRANIDNYVCTIAQYLRWNLSIANWANGVDKTGNSNALYAIGPEFRKVDNGAGNTRWEDVYHPIHDAANFPVYARCGLTGWNPFYFATGNKATGVPDFNTVLSATDRAKMSTNCSALLTYMNARHGMFVRNTSCPTLLRFQEPATDVLYSANATAARGATNHSHPLRLSTHLFHDVADMDYFLDKWATDVDMQAMLELNGYGE